MTLVKTVKFSERLSQLYVNDTWFVYKKSNVIPN